MSDTGIIDICNRALAEVNAQSSITDLEEPSTEAQSCKLFYNTMRRQLLRSAHWNFAKRTTALSLLGQGTASIMPWPSMYAYPPDCLAMRYILPGLPASAGQVVGGEPAPVVWRPSAANRWQIQSAAIPDGLSGAATRQKVVLSNVNYAVGVYTADETDPDMFDDLFTQGLVSALAYKLAIPITGSPELKAQFAQESQASVMNARVSDGNEGFTTTDHTPDWIQARLSTGMDAPAFALGSWWGGCENFNWS